MESKLVSVGWQGYQGEYYSSSHQYRSLILKEYEKREKNLESDWEQKNNWWQYEFVYVLRKKGREVASIINNTMIPFSIFIYSKYSTLSSSKFIQRLHTLFKPLLSWNPEIFSVLHDIR